MGCKGPSFLETRNLQFDRVFILDANDDVLPGNKGHDVLLPVKLRESLGLSTFRDKERMEAYYFNCLLQGAKEVHLFFIQDGKKEEKPVCGEAVVGYGAAGEENSYKRARSNSPLPDSTCKHDAGGDSENRKRDCIPEGFFIQRNCFGEINLKCQLRFYYRVRDGLA